MQQIITSWNGPQGSFLRTIMYFSGTDEAAAAAARAAVGTLWGGYDGVMSNQYSWSVEPLVKVLNPITGGLVGEIVEPTPHGAPGAQAQQPVADATQVLFQWHTPLVVNRRLVRGRTYAPGLAQGSTTGGNLSGGVRAALVGVGVDFIDEADGTFGVWHRPTNGVGGVHVEVTSHSVWSELAVQRRRRA